MNRFSCQSSPKEVTVQKYVGFYRFWAWEYTRRNAEFRNLQKQFAATQAYFSQMGFPSHVIEGEAFVEWEVFADYMPEGSGGDRDIAFKRINSLYSDQLNSRHKFGFNLHGPATSRIYFADEILKALEKEEALFRPGEPRERTEVIRLVAECEIENGIKSLKYGELPILGYDALVAIDFDRPISEIQSQIENTKKDIEIYRKIRNSETDWDLESNRLEIEKVGIQRNPEIPTQTGTDNPRAIGLWLWDYINSDDSPNQGATQIAAIKSLKANYKLDKLGAGASEESVFRKWYRNTAKCIEAAEVLSFR